MRACKYCGYDLDVTIDGEKTKNVVFAEQGEQGYIVCLDLPETPVSPPKVSVYYGNVQFTMYGREVPSRLG